MLNVFFINFLFVDLLKDEGDEFFARYKKAPYEENLFNDFPFFGSNNVQDLLSTLKRKNDPQNLSFIGIIQVSRSGI